MIFELYRQAVFNDFLWSIYSNFMCIKLGNYHNVIIWCFLFEVKTAF